MREGWLRERLFRHFPGSTGLRLRLFLHSLAFLGLWLHCLSISWVSDLAFLYGLGFDACLCYGIGNHLAAFWAGAPGQAASGGNGAGDGNQPPFYLPLAAEFFHFHGFFCGVKGDYQLLFFFSHCLAPLRGWVLLYVDFCLFSGDYLSYDGCWQAFFFQGCQ